MTALAMRKALRWSYDEAIARVPEALKSEGFGVLTEIDMRNTLAQKLGVDFRRYKIFGACNPPFAYEALQTDLDIGLVLPCNVVVYENDEGQAVVMAADPAKIASVIGNPKLATVAEAIRETLSRALSKLE